MRPLPPRPFLARRLAVALLALPTTALPAQESADAALASARHALGWDALAAGGGAVRIEGAARFLGTDARQTVLFDAHGRFLQTIEGPLSQANGTDGRTTWTRDWTGTPRVLALGDLAAAEVSTLFLTGGWTSAEAPLRFTLDPSGSGDALRLAFTHADGILTGSVTLDAATRLPRAARFTSDGSEQVWTFEHWVDHDGFAFPEFIGLVQSGLAQELATESVTRLASVPEATFAPRLDPPRDARFDPAVPPELEVRRTQAGYLLVHPSVDGEDLGWFLFDSGAGTNCIARSVTEALAEGPFGEMNAKGVGGTVPARFWRADELRLGPLTLADPILLELDLAFLEPHFGVPIGGILGFELLSRCVAELDMREGAIALHAPDRYALPEGGHWEEAILSSRHPCVRAAFEDHEGVFKIDTGAASDTVTLHTRVVRDLDLLSGRETRAGSAGGVGGTVATRLGTLATFRLGGHEFTALPASFSQAEKGAFHEDYVWGNIGGKLLEPFLLVFDYPDARLGFVRRD